MSDGYVTKFQQLQTLWLNAISDSRFWANSGPNIQLGASLGSKMHQNECELGYKECKVHRCCITSRDSEHYVM